MARHVTTRMKLVLLLASVTLLAACAARKTATTDTLTISVIGTNDVHGELISKPGRGGLTGISGFIDAVRAARDRDNGAVLVIDAGDMWQGTLESNLVEGAAVVEAYDAIGVAAAAIGNHEFDFGPAGSNAIPQEPDDDPRGALKQRATESSFPLLAANLIDDATGKPVEWQNVRPTALVDVQGIRIGIIGVMSEGALQATIAANTSGLSVAPLVETIIREGKALRDAGATIVVVTAHAGSRCTEFEDPTDLSSCNMAGEIMRAANALPRGLVDHIIAGHVHQGIAHVVNGVSVTSSYSNTRAFSRVDLTVDRASGTAIAAKVFPPQRACLRVIAANGQCATPEDDPVAVVGAMYEGQAVVPNPDVAAIANRAREFAEAIKNESLGVYLESAFPHPPATESPLANLMTDAMLQSIDADIAIHNVVGGIRNTLPQGDLTFGAVYEMFPFDNRIVLLDISGAELRAVLARQAHRYRRRAGIAGIRVFIACQNDALSVVAKLDSGETIQDDDRVTVIANDFLTLGGDDLLTPIMPSAGFAIDESMPLVRDVLVEWFRAGPATLRPEDFLSTDSPRWTVSDEMPATCSLRVSETAANNNE